MIDIFLDIETYSSEDLTESGVYRYTEAPDFSILWLSYQVNSGPIITIDMTCITEEGKMNLRNMLLSPQVRLHAHNAQFERVCLDAYLHIKVPISKWHCTMVLALMNGLPGGLDACAQALGLVYGKLAGGKALISYFCKPRKPTKNDLRTRNMPTDNPDKWQQFGSYNARDVEIEKMIYDKLQYFVILPEEREMWELDQHINDTGILPDLDLATRAIQLYDAHQEAVITQLQELTGLDNPNSLPQIKRWVADQEPALKGISLNKDSKEEVMARIKRPLVRKVLGLRWELSSVSIQKYQKILSSCCADQRLRGTIQYYGAGRTGRFAGRGVQPHNLVKTEIEPVELARALLKGSDSFMLKAIWDDLPYCLSQLIRTALIPSPGHLFCISDFSAIEAVVLSWQAGEQWRLDVFRGHGKIYEASASKMFGVPIEKIDKRSPYRARGKVAELALGYQGGAAALIRMGALKMGIKEEELTSIVYQWRAANKRIVAYWYAIENAFRECLRNGTSKHGNIKMEYRQKRLSVILPSGRLLIYQQPKAAGDGSLYYMGTHPTTKQWVKIDTYGGKIVENIVQAIARDLLVCGLLRVNKAGFVISLHVHDEIVCEVPTVEATQCMKVMDTLMRTLPSWATDIPLKAVTILSPFYKKD